jgi:hypothetical protein
MKQTAVEWLENEFKEAHKMFGGIDTNWIKRFEQAKAMEKEQSHAEYMRGWKDGLTSSSGVTYRCCGLRLSIHGCGCPQETLKSE